MRNKTIIKLNRLLKPNLLYEQHDILKKGSLTKATRRLPDSLVPLVRLPYVVMPYALMPYVGMPYARRGRVWETQKG